MKLIGFTGLAGSGKDEAGIQLHKSIGNQFKFKDMQFGYAVKLLCSQIFQVPIYMFYRSKHEYCEKHKMTYREMLQKFATDFIRDTVNKDFWVNYLAENYTEFSAQNRYNLIAITDVRFNNEAQWIKDRGGIIIEIFHPDVKPLEHASEKQIDPLFVHTTITNDGSKKKLRNNLEVALNRFLNS